jgi:hypothetical protein
LGISWSRNWSETISRKGKYLNRPFFSTISTEKSKIFKIVHLMNPWMINELTFIFIFILY